MDQPEVNATISQHRPVDSFTAVLPDGPAVDALLPALADLGVASGEISVLQGPEGERAFDLEGEHHGAWAHLVRSWKNLGGADAEMLARYDSALRRGRWLVLVPSPGEAVHDEVVAALRGGGARSVTYFGQGTMQTS